MEMETEKNAVVIYTRYERFWHWSQAALIFILAFSGFVIHGTFNVVDFETAVTVHTYSALLLLLLWLFTTFWNFTTGNWKQFLPRIQGLPAVIRYYAWDMLFGKPHPHTKSMKRKQNALQGLAYLTFMVILGPALWISGSIYLTYDLWNVMEGSQSLFQAVTFFHTAAAFMMMAFAFIHIYMTTTGKTPFHYIKTMITGVESIELTQAEKAYFSEQHPKILRDHD